MRKIIFLFCLLASMAVQAQRPFVIKGNVPSLPDGTAVGISAAEDSIVELAQDTVRNGQFTLRGTVKGTVLAMLSTNNLDLVDKNHWPMDSIHWNYIDLFLSADTMTLSPDLKIHGGRVQEDFKALQAIGDWHDPAATDSFAATHPTSAVTVWIVNNDLKRGFHLSDTDVERLSRTLTACPDDPARYQEFLARVAQARKSTVGKPFIDLQIKDPKGNILRLKDVVTKGKYVLVDFWASWCGQCLAAFPKVEEIGKKYASQLRIIDLSIDIKGTAWQHAMQKHPQPWPQYCTTPQGYKDLFSKYQIGNGVPYFILISPEGKVIGSPTIDEIEPMLENAGLTPSLRGRAGERH